MSIEEEASACMRWATIIPLIGGSAIGCAKSTGVLPLYNMSYEAFAKNEKHLATYWPQVPMLYLDNLSKEGLKKLKKQQDIDFVTSVCPCAGLSTLNNCQKGKAARGSEAVQNDWMLKSAAFVLSVVKPKVFWGENAPGLFTKSGKGLVIKLKLIGQKFGYSFSLFKTNSELHGLPQRRMRTFYFFWRSPCVPLFPWMKVKPPGLLEYLSLIPSWATLQDVYVHDGRASKRFRPYQFLLKRERMSHQEFSKKMERGMTVARYLERNGLIGSCIKWLKKYYPKEKFSSGSKGKTHIHFLRRMRKKLAQGRGYWDVSVKFMGKSFTAVISKNILHAVHPIEDRFFSIRELLHLMGMPHDFKIDDVKNVNHICQNVPVNTAKDIADEVVKFCKGESVMTKFAFLKQDNVSRKVVETEPLVQDEDNSKVEEGNMRRKIVKVEETIVYSIKRKFVEAEPTVQDDEFGKMEDFNMLCSTEDEPLVQGEEIVRVKDVNKRSVLGTEPLIQDEEDAKVEAMDLVCSTKKRVDSGEEVSTVPGDERDKDVVMVCTTKRTWRPEKKQSSVLEEVSGSAFHEVDENGNISSGRVMEKEESYSHGGNKKCKILERSPVSKLEEALNLNSSCDGEGGEKCQRIEVEGIIMPYEGLDYQVEIKEKSVHPRRDFHSNYIKFISEKLKKIEEESKESFTCSTCGLDSSRIGLRSLNTSALAQLEDAFHSSSEAFDFQEECKRRNQDPMKVRDLSEELFTCSLCGLNFSMAEFVKHRKDWTCSPEYKCEFCGKTFKGAGRFMKHRSRSMHFVR